MTELRSHRRRDCAHAAGLRRNRFRIAAALLAIAGGLASATTVPAQYNPSSVFSSESTPSQAAPAYEQNFNPVGSGTNGSLLGGSASSLFEEQQTQQAPAGVRPPGAPQYGVIQASGTSQQLPPQPSKPALKTIEELLGENVAAVRVEGNKSIPTYAIERQITKTRAGRPIIQEQIREDKTTLINTRWFLSVRERIEESPEGPVVIFQVIERPILQRVEFIGNKKFNSDKLSRETGLVAGHGFDVSANQESVSRIRQMYYDKGYVHAKVDLKTGGHPDDREVVIVIDEGPKVAVSWISFEGNQFVSGPVLKTKLSTRTQWLMLIGGAYNPDSIQSDVATLKSYYESLGFFDVNVEAHERVSDDRKRVHVVFAINEGLRYQVRNIETSGNAMLSREQLLTDLKLAPGDAFNSRFLQADTQAMRDKYDELGRPFANVQPVPRFLNQPGVLDLVYDVDESQVMRIGMINIRVRGDETHTRTDVIRNRINRYLKPGEIARASDLKAAQAILRGDPIVDRETPPSFNIRRVEGQEYFPPTNLARGQSNAVSFAADPGPTTITAGLFKPSIDQQTLWTSPGVSSWFDVAPEAGFDSAVEPVSFTDDALPPAARVAPPVAAQPAPAAASVAPGDGFLQPMTRARQPTAAAEQVATAQPNTTGQLAFADKPSLAPQTVFRAQSGDPFLMAQGQVDPRAQSIGPNGLPDPQNYLFGTSPQGDPFGNALRGPGPAPGFVDVDIDFTEGRTGRLMFGAGVNSDAGVVGSLVLQEDNFDITRFPTSWADIASGRAFRGGGQSFRIELVPGTQVSRYNVSWRDPYIFGTDFSFGTDAFYYNRFFQNWTEDRAGGRLSLGYILNRHWSFSTALRMENVQFRNFTHSVLTPQSYLDVAGDNFLSTAQFKLAYDTRDSAFLPSKGHFAELAYEQAFGEFLYSRVELTGSQYFTLYERPDGGGKHILELRGQGIWTGDDTPVFERLYAGGFQSFRGFQFRGITPREGPFQVGGNFMTVGSVEYIFPITAGDALRGVVFSDFGTVDKNVTLDDFRVSAGFGFRISVPVMGPAPIALDFAWPVRDKPEDQQQVFSFYVGTTW